jgi:hypothetical protein
MEPNFEVLSRLEEISTEFDKVISILRGSQADKKRKVRNWIVTWLLLPFSTLTDIKALFKGVKNLNLSPALPLLTGTILSPMATFISEKPWYLLMAYGLLAGYIFSFIFIAPRTMCQFDSGYFRIGAYAFFRKQEYDMFKKTLLHDDNTLYFTPIYHQMSLLMNKEHASKEHIEIIHKRIDTFLNQEKAHYLAQIKSLQDKFEQKEQEHKQAIKEYDDELEKVVQKSKEVHIGIQYIVEFLKATNTALYRIKNNCFSIADITNMVSCGITIYEMDNGGTILRKKYDEGTSGSSPSEISLEDSKYATARAVTSEDDVEIDEPSPGRFVVSRKMKMGYNKIWVINFHFDESQEKPLFLTVSNDILNTQEVMRMIHALCLLKQEADYAKGES